MEEGEESYPYWQMYVVPVLESFRNPPNDLKILVPACGGSRMTEELYDLGYLKITSVDGSRDVIFNMLQRHQLRRELKWRHGDISHMKFGKEAFNVVIDKGTLDALSSAEIQKYLEKVKDILTTGGRFICFIHCNSEAIDSVLQLYRTQYKTTFKKLAENNSVTMIVVEKVEVALPHLISEYDSAQDAILCEAIRKENSRRLKLLYDMEISLSDVESGVIGDPNVISVGRNFMFHCVVKRRTYNVLVLDVAPLQDCYSWDIFFTKSELLRWPVDMSEDHWLMIASHAHAARVYVVLLDANQENYTIERLERDFEVVFQKLAPKNTGNSSFRSRKITEDELLNTGEGDEAMSDELLNTGEGDKTIGDELLNIGECDELLNIDAGDKTMGDKLLNIVEGDEAMGHESGDGYVDSQFSQPPASIEGSLSMTCPHTTAGNFSIRGACSDPCLGGYSIRLGSMGEFHVDRNNNDSNFLLGGEKYELTLTKWLSQNKEDMHVWCKKKEVWNNQGFRRKFKLDVVEGWNSSRPTEECSQVIQGILNAVSDYQSGNESNSQLKIYGNPRNTDCYLMTNRTSDVSGFPHRKVHVILNPSMSRCSSFSSISMDMEDLEYVVFKDILKGKALPRLWANLKAVIALFKEPKLSVQNTMITRKLLKNHPAFWCWRRRIDYIQNIWMQSHDISYPQKAVLDGILRRLRCVDWKGLVPNDTPLHRILSARHYDNDS